MDDPAPPRSSAELQTDWAAERTLLAVERTYAGWLRTGMGAIGVAIGTHAVFVRTSSDWPPRIASSIFLFIALLIFIAGHHHARGLLRDLAAERPLPQQGHFTRLSALFVAATCAIAILLWRM